MKKQLSVLRKLYHNRWSTKPAFDKPELNAESAELLRKLKHDGIVVVPNFFSKEKAETIRQVVEKKFDSITVQEWEEIKKNIRTYENRFGYPMADGTKCWTDKMHSDVRCNGSENLSPDIYAFAYDENLKAIGADMLQRNIDVRWCLANRITYVEGNLGSGGGWHRDMTYRNGFKALVYLTDVDETTGCFQYLKKSSSAFHHLLKTPTPDKYQYTHDEVLKMVGNNESAIFNVTGNAGTLVLFDTNGVHRGKPIEKGVRYALTNYYKD